MWFSKIYVTNAAHFVDLFPSLVCNIAIGSKYLDFDIIFSKFKLI